MENLRKFKVYRDMKFALWSKLSSKSMAKMIKRLKILNRRIDTEKDVHYEKIEQKIPSEDPSLFLTSGNCCFLTLQGSDPIKMAGFLCGENIYLYWIKDGKIEDFYIRIMEIMSLLVEVDILCFGFTYKEYDTLLEIRDILRDRYSQKKGKFQFLNTLKYFILQERDRQTINEMLLSIDLEFPETPISRREDIDALFKEGFIGILKYYTITHLKSLVLIFSHIYLKKHRLPK